MTVRMIIATGALLASTSAWAQAARSDQTTEDLVCQLSDKCTDAAAAPADQVEAAATGPVDRAAPRVSATRGFKIARKVDGPAATGSTGYTAVRPATTSAGKAAPRIAYESGKKTSAPAMGKTHTMTSANAKVMPMGRADLRVTFVTGSAELTESGQREAQKFAAALGSPLLQGMRFTIEGHTDAVGARASNQDLSRRRATAVVDYLVGKGVDRARFDTVGYGSDRPLDGISATAALNRRVEVVRNK